MIKKINFNDFCNSFSDSYKNNFSYEGKQALFDYLEQYEEETGEQIELDIVSLCCDYTEYENLNEIQVHYPNIKNIDDLKDNTTVIEFNSGIIIQIY